MIFEVSRVPQKDQMGTGDNFWSLGAFKSIIAAMMHPKGTIVDRADYLRPWEYPVELWKTYRITGSHEESLENLI